MDLAGALDHHIIDGDLGLDSSDTSKAGDKDQQGGAHGRRGTIGLAAALQALFRPELYCSCRLMRFLTELTQLL